MQSKVWLVLSFLCAAVFGSTPAQSRNLEDHQVVDIWANRRLLSEFRHADTKALVLMFMVRECPIVELYLPRIKEMEAQYRARGVQFLAVYPSAGETLNTVAMHGQDNDIAFPLLLEKSFELTDALGVERSSEVVVLDRDFQVRYQGAIDDQYRVSGRQSNPEKNYLRDALEHVLAGDASPLPRTVTSGCLLERPAPAADDLEVTYTKDVAPIVQEKCAGCHRPGQVGPFSLLTYRDAKRFASMIAEVVDERRMPPWHAVMDEAKFGPFANDRRLSDDEIKVILAWVRTGAREGNPQDLPPARQWPTDWQIPQPDAVIEMPEEFQVPATGEVPYMYYTVPTTFDRDMWIRASEAQAGDSRAVHHINVHITRPDLRPMTGIMALWQLFGRDGSKADPLATFIPGDSSREYPEGYGVLLPKGHTLTFEVHYTPFGQPTVDRSRVGLVFSPEPPRQRLRFHAVITRDITIPPGDPHFKVRNMAKFPTDIAIVSLRPHMHKRGKHVRYELEAPDGSRETLLSIPRWEFNWQSTYEFAKPVRVPKGTKVVMTTVYDNSVNNPNNPDPTQSVTFGLQTWDEMMNGNITYVALGDEL